MLRRALSKGFTLATRTKRTYIFVFIFALLVFSEIFALNSINIYETDSLLNIRGCIVVPDNPITKAEFMDSNLSKKFNDLRLYARGIYLVYGVSLDIGGTKIGFVWLESWGGVEYKSEVPWVVEEIKPTKIVEGLSLDFESENQGIIGRTLNMTFYLGGVSNISILAGVGGTVVFNIQGTPIEVKIVGKSTELFDGFASLLDVDATSIIFVTEQFMDKLISSVLSELYGDAIDDYIYVLRIIITAKGDIMNINTLLGINNEIDQNRDEIYKIVGSTEFEPEEITILRGKQLLQSVMLTFAMFMGFLFGGILYAWILVIFRRMDIATLRAIGWGSGHIFMLVLGEFMLTLFLGTFLGATVAGVYLIFAGVPMSNWPFLATAGIALFSLIIGLFFLRKKVLRIPPMEAFRAQ